MDTPEPTERWWIEFRLWPFAFRIEAEILLETRGLPGMKYYQCAWNDLIALFWKIVRYNDRSKT